jgi:hypothetical protein
MSLSTGLSPVLSHLPKEIIIYILQFGTAMRYRNGKFMNRIQPNDSRYELLSFVNPAQIHYDDGYWFPSYYFRQLGSYRLFLYIRRELYRPANHTIVFYNHETENIWVPQYIYVMP